MANFAGVAKGDPSDDRWPFAPVTHCVGGWNRSGDQAARGQALPVNLTIGLHAADDEFRSRLVPINRRDPLAELERAATAKNRSSN